MRHSNKRGGTDEWYLLTFGWKINQKQFISRETPFELQEYNMIAALPRNCLVYLARKMGNVGEGNTNDLTSIITRLSLEERQVLAMTSSSTSVVTKVTTTQPSAKNSVLATVIASIHRKRQVPLQQL